MHKFLLLDLDGTIREPISNAKFINEPYDQRPIEGADRAIAHYYAHDWIVIGITNQGGVAAGHKTLEDCFVEQAYTLELFPQMLKIYFCPDFEGKQLGCVYRSLHNLFTPEGYSSFRKPAPGMLEYVLATHDVGECWYVGDRPEDVQAAEAAGINYIDAKVWRDRFLPGIHEHAVSPRQLEFLEGLSIL